MPSSEVLILLGIAVLNAYTAWRSHQIEKNTNSMKDALVASASREGHAAGVTQGRAEEKADAKMQG